MLAVNICLNSSQLAVISDSQSAAVTMGFAVNILSNFIVTTSIYSDQCKVLNTVKVFQTKYLFLNLFSHGIKAVKDPSLKNMSDTKGHSAGDQGSDNDPFFVHHSNNPTAVLVSPLLTGDNFSTWLRAMTMALRAKNKSGFIDGTIKPPMNDKELKKWQRCNDLVSSWILNSTEADIRASILYAETAREIWTDLNDWFAQTNAPKIYQLKQLIASLKQEDTSISAYTKMKALWDELNMVTVVQPCICGHGKESATQQQQDRTMEFLQGLHD